MNRLFSLKKLAFVLFLITSGLTIYSKFISCPASLPLPLKLDEKFDRNLGVINTPLKLDSLVKEKFEHTGYDTATTLLFFDEFLRNRFYHSYSELSFKDNWLAFLCGHIFWTHFLNPVRPVDILKFPMAGCSQQGILFQHELDELKIPSSSIQFYPQKNQTSGHYTTAAYYGHTWHYFDSNLEPIIVDSTMPSVESIIERKLFTGMYTRKVHEDFKEYFLNKSYKQVKYESSRKGNMYYFQTISSFLSSWIWLLFLILYLILFFRATK